MVMRNRHDGGQTPQWWDDLPPRVRERFSHPPDREETLAPDSRRAAGTPAEARPSPSRGELIIDLSQLALFFVIVCVGILLYLLVALSYING